MSERTLPAFTVGACLFFLSLFVALAAIIQTGAAVRFDSFLRDRVHDFAFPGLTEAMSLVTLLGSPIVLGSLTILLFCFFSLGRAAGRRIAFGPGNDRRDDTRECSEVRIPASEA